MKGFSMDFKKIQEIFSSYYLAIPDYQRDYSWTEAEISTLFDDIKNLMINNSSEEHFLGAIVTTSFDSESSSGMDIVLEDYKISPDNIRHVVDGQQRLTTISLLMRAAMDLASQTVVLKEQKNIIQGYLRNLESCLYGSEMTNDGKSAPRLFLNGNTAHVYMSDKVLGISKISGQLKYKGAKRLIKAFDYLKLSIKELCDEYCTEYNVKPYEFYRAFFQMFTSQLKFVVIECNTAMNAFQVFDSLNGKGNDLTAADRIKNIFLSWCNNKNALNKWNSLISPLDQDNLVKFFTCYMFYLNGKRVQKRRLPDEYKNEFSSSATVDFDNFYQNQVNAAEIYGKITSKSTGIKSLDDEVLADLATLNQEQAYLPLFAVLLHFDTKTNAAAIIEFGKSLCSLITRMQVCEKSNNRLDAIFAECIKKIKNNESIPVLTTFIDSKKIEIANDAQFKSAFQNLSIKDMKQAKYYLVGIENYLRGQNGDRNKVDVSSKLTVEHIIPQDESAWNNWFSELDFNVSEDDYSEFSEMVIPSIGNMLLLYDDDNSAAGKNTLSEKIKVYRQGSNNSTNSSPMRTFMLVEDFVNQYEKNGFSNKSVEERSEKLANLAIEVW